MARIPKVQRTRKPITNIFEIEKRLGIVWDDKKKKYLKLKKAKG